MPRPQEVFFTYQITRQHSVCITVPQAQLSLSSIYELHMQMVHRPRTHCKVVSLYWVTINTIDYTKNGMSTLDSRQDSYRWCRPVAGECQNEFGGKETEIFPQISSSEYEIFIFWSSVPAILDDSLWDLVTITKGVGLMRIYVLWHEDIFHMTWLIRYLGLLFEWSGTEGLT